MSSNLETKIYKNFKSFTSDEKIRIHIHSEGAEANYLMTMFTDADRARYAQLTSKVRQAVVLINKFTAAIPGAIELFERIFCYRSKCYVENPDTDLSDFIKIINDSCSTLEEQCKHLINLRNKIEELIDDGEPLSTKMELRKYVLGNFDFITDRNFIHTFFELTKIDNPNKFVLELKALKRIGKEDGDSRNYVQEAIIKFVDGLRLMRKALEGNDAKKSPDDN